MQLTAEQQPVSTQGKESVSVKLVAREEADCLLPDRELLPLSSEGTLQFRGNFCRVG